MVHRLEEKGPPRIDDWGFLVPFRDQSGVAGSEDQAAWMIGTWAHVCRTKETINVRELYNMSKSQDEYPTHSPDDVINDLEAIIRWYQDRQQL